MCPDWLVDLEGNQKLLISFSGANHGHAGRSIEALVFPAHERLVPVSNECCSNINIAHALIILLQLILTNDFSPSRSERSALNEGHEVAKSSPQNMCLGGSPQRGGVAKRPAAIYYLHPILRW